MFLKTRVEDGKAQPGENARVSPPFCTVQMDIAYGLNAVSWKKARNEVNLYAIVIACSLTSAMSYLSLKRLECQDMVAAMEKHSAMYEVPGAVFVDNGTKLDVIMKANFAPWTLENEFREKLEVRVVILCSKAYKETGRVERRMGLIRKMLQLTGQGVPSPWSR